MAHFAKLDSNNKVIVVHAVHNNELLVDEVENEQKGIDFLNNLLRQMITGNKLPTILITEYTVRTKRL